ncbi:MAG: hypothetical protein FWF80_08250 [Defluviitaleaceae bacterium]|nr:hypothetical protein [Defluviitaleaceae bacterium]
METHQHKNEHLIKFENEVALPFIHSTVNNIKETIIADEKSFVQKYQNIADSIFDLIKSLKTEPAYIGFVMLRSKLLYGEYFYDVHLYSEKWYLENYVKIAETDVSDFFSDIDTVRNYLEKERLKIAGKICLSDIDNIISENLFEFAENFIYVLKKAITHADFTGKTKIYTSELYGKPILINEEIA